MAKPPKKAKKHQPGPSSRDEVLSHIDRRTRAGRVLRTVEAELTADLGGDPTAGERLLIQSAAVKATRLALLSDQLLDGTEIQSDQHGVLAWANSLRLDLMALGLQRRAREVGLPGAPAKSSIRDRALAAPAYEGAAA